MLSFHLQGEAEGLYRAFLVLLPGVFEHSGIHNILFVCLPFYGVLKILPGGFRLGCGELSSFGVPDS